MLNLSEEIEIFQPCYIPTLDYGLAMFLCNRHKVEGHYGFEVRVPSPEPLSSLWVIENMNFDNLISLGEATHVVTNSRLSPQNTQLVSQLTAFSLRNVTQIT